MNAEQRIEWLACAKSKIYFAVKYCRIYDSGAQTWIPFDLWGAQARTLQAIQANPLTIILKARQLGLTWLVLSYALHDMLFSPIAEVLLFSRRDDEAVHLLDDRLKGMYNRLPEWLQARGIVTSNSHEFSLSNGSTARAFPTSAGDSYTATLAVVDEADLVPDFNRLMRAVKPTIDTGGRMVLLSRADKTKPESEFKRIYRAARDGKSPWHAVFLPWHVRPERDAAWYDAQRADIVARTGSTDDLFEQYPESDIQALSPRTLDKRIPFAWLSDCYVAMEAVDPLPDDAPDVPSLTIYRTPIERHVYVIGVDPAEGNPTSDDSALQVCNAATGEQMAVLHGKFEPETIADYIDRVGAYYNNAAAMVERNNHGHAVLLALRNTGRTRILDYPHDSKPGWLSNHLGKTTLYADAVATFRAGNVTVHHASTLNQLASIEGSSLRAPDGQFDDLADAFALALVARAVVMTPDAPMRTSAIKSRPGSARTIRSTRQAMRGA